MEPYEKGVLDKLVTLTEENNKILRSLNRHSRWGIFFGVIKWTIVLAPIVAAYFYFQPYLGNIREILEKLPNEFKQGESLNTKFGEGVKNVKSLFQITPDELPDKLP